MKAKIHFANADELLQLLSRAITLTDQLKEAIHQIESFEPVIETSLQEVPAATETTNIETDSKKIIDALTKEAKNRY